MATTTQKPVVIVTGASKYVKGVIIMFLLKIFSTRGIGLAVTEALLETFKAAVVTLSRSQSPELTALMRKYPADLLAMQVDVLVASTHPERPTLTASTEQMRSRS